MAMKALFERAVYEVYSTNPPDLVAAARAVTEAKQAAFRARVTARATNAPPGDAEERLALAETAFAEARERQRATGADPYCPDFRFEQFGVRARLLTVPQFPLCPNCAVPMVFAEPPLVCAGTAHVDPIDPQTEQVWYTCAAPVLTIKFAPESAQYVRELHNQTKADEFVAALAAAMQTRLAGKLPGPSINADGTVTMTVDSAIDAKRIAETFELKRVSPFFYGEEYTTFTVDKKTIRISATLSDGGGCHEYSYCDACHKRDSATPALSIPRGEITYAPPKRGSVPFSNTLLFLCQAYYLMNRAFSMHNSRGDGARRAHWMDTIEKSQDNITSAIVKFELEEYDYGLSTLQGVARMLDPAWTNLKWYTAQLRKPDTWADDPELPVMAKFIGRPLRVFNVRDDTVTVITYPSPDHADAAPLNVVFGENHYDLAVLRPPPRVTETERKKLRELGGAALFARYRPQSSTPGGPEDEERYRAWKNREKPRHPVDVLVDALVSAPAPRDAHIVSDYTTISKQEFESMFAVEKVAGDGTCFFHAVAKGHGDGDGHRLRQDLADYMDRTENPSYPNLPNEVAELPSLRVLHEMNSSPVWIRPQPRQDTIIRLSPTRLSRSDQLDDVLCEQLRLMANSVDDVTLSGTNFRIGTIDHIKLRVTNVKRGVPGRHVAGEVDLPGGFAIARFSESPVAGGYYQIWTRTSHFEATYENPVAYHDGSPGSISASGTGRHSLAASFTDNAVAACHT